MSKTSFTKFDSVITFNVTGLQICTSQHSFTSHLLLTNLTFMKHRQFQLSLKKIMYNFISKYNATNPLKNEMGVAKKTLTDIDS